MLKIFLIIILILFVIFYTFKIKFSLAINNLLYIFISIFILFDLWVKDKSSYTDNYTYLVQFTVIKGMNFYTMIMSDIFEPFFRIISWLILLRFSVDNTFNIIVIITNVVFFITIHKIFKDKQLSNMLLIIYVLSPFIDYTQNILRQTFCIALLYLTVCLNKKISKIFVAFCSMLIHISVLPILLIQPFAKKLKIKYLVILLAISVILYITDINSMIFGNISYFEKYYNDLAFARYGSSNNRIDFLMATLFIVVISLILYNVKVLERKILTYVLVSSIYFCLMAFQAFSDRYALFVWFIFPYLTVLIIKMFSERIKIK